MEKLAIQDKEEFRRAAGRINALALPRGRNAVARRLQREDFTEAMPFSAYSLTFAKYKNCSSHTHRTIRQFLQKMKLGRIGNTRGSKNEFKNKARMEKCTQTPGKAS